MSDVTILSTKKLKPNQKAFLLGAGFSVVEGDFINVREKEIALEGINENLIFTSANAVNAVAQHPGVQDIRRNPCFCVGEKTAELLDEVGFTAVEIADNASELAAIIKNGYQSESFTFFCGNLRLETLPISLKNAGIALSEIEVYQTVMTPVEIGVEVDGILFFSPSAIESYLMRNNVTHQVCFCIGQTTASALDAITDNIIVANKPSVENVIIQCINFFSRTTNERDKIN